MFDVIEKLLILQDRDRRILRTRDELSRVAPERQMLQDKSAQTQGALDAAKLRVKQIESDRKKLELDVDAKKTQIEKYGLQQFQTKKNEEFRALAHEMDACKAIIVTLEDQQLVLMEDAEGAQKQVVIAGKEAQEAKKAVDEQLKGLADREHALTAELAALEASRGELTTSIEVGTLARYNRLLKHKGENVVVGIDHGVCGGCHMKFPTQILVSCQAAQELVCCPNCGRILYYTRDMDLAVAE